MLASISKFIVLRPERCSIILLFTYCYRSIVYTKKHPVRLFRHTLADT